MTKQPPAMLRRGSGISVDVLQAKSRLQFSLERYVATRGALSIPEEEREAFSLVRLQGMTHAEAAEVIGVAPRTVQRRLNRSVFMLSERLGDLVDVAGGREGPADGML